jgi:exopolysaccharide production protein ExoQ
MPDAPSDAPRIGGWERAFLVIALLLQQAAFIPLPEALLGLDEPLDVLGNPADPARSNLSNFVLTLACFVILGLLSTARLRTLSATIKQNPLVVATAVLVLASVLWSFDPMLSLRRAGSYSLGVLLALYLVERAPADEIVRLLALSTTLPAIASVIYAVLAPDLAYMQSPEVEGNLRGVYAHKNQIAHVMAIGFVLQVYLALTTKRWLRHLALAALHAFLVVKAHSASATVSLALFVPLLALYRIGRFNRQIATLMMLAGAGLVAVLGIVAIEQPEELFAVLGRDPTLTGRTALWSRVLDAIAERPFLGWGYTAFWEVDNDLVLRIWSQIGWNPPNAHNGFLEIALDFGVPGLLLGFAMLARFVLATARFTANHAGYEAWIYWAMLAYTLFNNIVETGMLRGQEFGWFTFLVLFMTCLARERGAQVAPREAPARATNSIVARAKPLAQPAARSGAPT